MNEQEFTYEHFDNASYLLAALGLGYFLLVMIPTINGPLVIAYSITWLIFFIYSIARFTSFIRRNRSLTQKEQGQIIKRHRYSLKWGYLVIPFSVFIPFVFSRIYDMTFVQIIGIFVVTFMLVSVFGIRLFLRNLKLRIKPLS
ncbi:MAG: hypothetical protein ACPGVT_13245 [Maricaulaceae bacterium]